MLSLSRMLINIWGIQTGNIVASPIRPVFVPY